LTGTGGLVWDSTGNFGLAGSLGWGGGTAIAVSGGVQYQTTNAKDISQLEG
jgi:hypothetical protein